MLYIFDELTHFNPRSPRGERPVIPADRRVVALISIHAPREGSDRRRPRSAMGVVGFQSTLPARGATTQRREALKAFEISIHAPREGSDPILSS